MKTHKTSGYLKIPSTIIKDQSISLESKGLYGVLSYYTQIPGFTITRNFLSNRHHIGSYSLKTKMMELQDQNYAECVQKKTGWKYSVKSQPDTFSCIPKTILSSDLSLKEIGLYMIIVHSMTLPDSRPCLDLYTSYCKDCRKSVMTASKLLQEAGLYVVTKINTCQYTYKLYTVTKNQSLDVLYEVEPDFDGFEKQETEVLSSKSNTENTLSSQKTNTLEDNVENISTKPDTIEESFKQMILYDRETSQIDCVDYQDFICKQKEKTIYDLIIEAVKAAKNRSYVSVNGSKIYYEKFYNEYLCKMADPYIRHIIVAKISDALDKADTVYDLNSYICGIIAKTIPFCLIKANKNEMSEYRWLESNYGSSVANEDYKYYRTNRISYIFKSGFFVRHASVNFS